MKPIRKPRLSPIEQRKQQLAKQIDELRHQAATKTQKSFKTDKGYEQWRKHWPERLTKLEAELSILNDPGEYDSLPTAVVAEELGLSIGLVDALIQYGEIEPTDTSEESRRDRVSRDELARVIEFGLDELLRLHEQDAAQIFEDALRHLQDGDLEAAEKAYRRIEERDSLIGHYALAYRIGLDLAKSNFDEAKSTIDFVLREEQIERSATLSYLARLLHSIRFNEHTVLVRSPVGPASANSHLATSANIFNELQPLGSAPVSVKIGLFPARIVTRLSQENASKHEPLPLFTVFCHLFRAQFLP